MMRQYVIQVHQFHIKPLITVNIVVKQTIFVNIYKYAKKYHSVCAIKLYQ